MKQEQIDRINALYRKSQAEGLTEAEKEEQAMLRKAYVADVKRSRLRLYQPRRQCALSWCKTGRFFL